MADGTMFTNGTTGTHGAAAAAAANDTSSNDDIAEGSLSLDHALLESLFYNEMMLMDEASSSMSTDFLSYVSGADSSRQQQQQQQCAITASDPCTLVERDLLRDFGVSSLPTPNNGHSLESWPFQVPPPPPSPPPLSIQPQAIELAPLQKYQQEHQQQYQTSLTPNLIHTTTATSSTTTTNVFTAPISLSTSTSASSLVSTATTTMSPALAGASMSSPTATTAATAVSQERAKQLVSQFATLASRLGIELPQNVLQSLIVTAATNENSQLSPPTASMEMESIRPTSPLDAPGSSHQVQYPAPTGSPCSAGHSTTSAMESLPGSPMKTDPVISRSLSAPMLHEAMAAVSLKRSWSGEEPNRTTNTTSNNNNNNLLSSNLSLDDSQQLQQQQPPYAKRRKKANLSECEARLAALKAENDMLKRHLHNVSNQTHKIDQERQNTATEMRRLFAGRATPEQIDAVVDRFSETYSDYGRHRHQELTFHLEQLQRLSTPTNFTKMGLWTLGQTGSNGKNPLAGILQRDLGITPQQGRKILEQRQKIKDVCANLKECLVLLAKLKTLCEQKTRIFHDRMNKAREILNPMQVVRLLIWIDEHSSLLAHLCPGWGSEHIVLAAGKKNPTNNIKNTTSSTTTTNINGSSDSSTSSTSAAP